MIGLTYCMACRLSPPVPPSPLTSIRSVVLGPRPMLEHVDGYARCSAGGTWVAAALKAVVTADCCRFGTWGRAGRF